MSATGFSGRLTAYALSYEATRGVGVLPSSNGFWIRYETADMFDTATTILNASALNVLDKYSGAEVVEAWGAGQIAGKITDHAIGLIFLGSLGGYSVGLHAGETVVYDHTFTEDQLNGGPTLTLTRQDPNTTLQYTKGTVNQLDIDVKTGDFVRHTTTFMTNPGVAIGTQTVTPSGAEQEFTAKHVAVQFSTGAVIPLASFKLSIMNSAANYWVLGQTAPGDIYQQSFEVKGEMVLRYSDQTYYNLRFNNTVEAVNITIQNTDVLIGSTSHPTIFFYMPTCYLNDFKVDNTIDGIVQQTVGFQAVATTANAYSIRAVLTNKHSTYLTAGIS